VICRVNMGSDKHEVSLGYTGEVEIGYNGGNVAQGIQ